MSRAVELSELMESLREQMPELRKRFGVARLAAFGSRVLNRASSDSDLDLLVVFDRTPGLLKFIELEHYLSERLGLRVDLVMEEALKPRLRPRILEQAVVV